MMPKGKFVKAIKVFYKYICELEEWSVLSKTLIYIKDFQNCNCMDIKYKDWKGLHGGC